MSIKIKEINFKDIYIGSSDFWLSGVNNECDPMPAPESCVPELLHVRSICDQIVSKTNRTEFSVRHDDVSYRVSVINSSSDIIYVLRKLSCSIPSINELGLPAPYVDKLMQRDISGLIVISGAYGQGKTTTASSLVASRLSRYGGVAITIEDPPEIALEGRHGIGVCYQMWVDDRQFGEAVRKTARYAPSIIFLGEVRDKESAIEVLRASINGRLTICTIHADSVPTTVERLYAYASDSNSGNYDDISSLLANGLLCIIHQKLIGNGDKKMLKTEFLWIGNDDIHSHGIRNTIRTRRFDQLANDVILQRNQMLISRKVDNDS